MKRMCRSYFAKSSNFKPKKTWGDGIINLKVYDEKKLRVEYSITPLGLALKNILYSIKKWAEKIWMTVSKNKEKYEAN